MEMPRTCTIPIGLNTRQGDYTWFAKLTNWRPRDQHEVRGSPDPPHHFSRPDRDLLLKPFGQSLFAYLHLL